MELGNKTIVHSKTELINVVMYDKSGEDYFIKSNTVSRLHLFNFHVKKNEEIYSFRSS